MFLSDLSIKRPILITMCVMSFAVLGFFSLLRLGVDIFPDIEFPFVMVSVVYPGAGPEELETQVVEPIEDEIATIAGIRHIQSTCREGLAIVGIEFVLGTDVDVVGLDVKEKVDALLPTLPEDLEPPTVLKFDIGDAPIMNLAVYAPRPLEEIYDLADDLIRIRLSSVEGIAQIDLEGGKKREIQVALSRSKLREHDLSVMSVIQSLQMANLNIPSGRIEEGRRDVTIRLDGEYNRPAEMDELQIALDEGRTVRLRDIGRVFDGFEDITTKARFNSESSVGLAVRKRSDANTVAVASGVRTELERLKQILPPDVEIAVARDNSVFISSALADVSSNLMLGILLTAFVLFLFTHSWKGTVIASIAMPISIIATFLLIEAAGFTLNTMSLTGLAISVGILVNNSIVVLENISVFSGRGSPPREAAAKGTSEIAVAVIASTLTNVVVFVPIGFMRGIVGQFFSQFGLTVAFATVFSLIVSFTLTPMMSARRLGRFFYITVIIALGAGILYFLTIAWFIVIASVVGIILILQSSGLLQRFFTGWDRAVDFARDSYERSLAWCFNNRKKLGFGTLIVFAGSFALFGVVGGEFMPTADQGTFYIALEMPPGTRLDETDHTLLKIEAVLAEFPEVKTSYVTAGVAEGVWGATEASYRGGILVQLVDEKLRNRSTLQIIKQLRNKVIDLPAADIVITDVGTFGGAGESDIQIEVTGNEMNEILTAVRKIQAIVERTPGTVDVTNSWVTGKPELRITPQREALADHDLSTEQVATTLRAMLEGVIATTYRESGEEYDVRVRLDERDRMRLEQVGNMDMWTGDYWIPLPAITKIEEAEGPATVYRKDKRRLVTITANLTSGTMTEAQKAIQAGIDSLAIPSTVNAMFGGEAEWMGREFGYIYQAMALAIILTYMLLCAIMESYIRPLIILLTLPLGLIGVAISLVLTTTPISMMVLMGMVMLVGIVVNNAILILDYAQVLREQGKSVREATLTAAPGRFRPILMANLATILGMTPLALGIGSGGEWRAPMAIASIGALITSCFFTLFLIPMLYEYIESRKERKAAS